jgi:hypothetical protein
LPVAGFVAQAAAKAMSVSVMKARNLDIAERFLELPNSLRRERALERTE